MGYKSFFIIYNKLSICTVNNIFKMAYIYTTQFKTVNYTKLKIIINNIFVKREHVIAFPK